MLKTTSHMLTVRNVFTEKECKKLCSSLPGRPDTEEADIPLKHILDVFGLGDAIMALRTQSKRYAKKFARLCAERAATYADICWESRTAAHRAATDTDDDMFLHHADGAHYVAHYAACAASYPQEQASEAAKLKAYEDEREWQKKVFLSVISEA